MITFNLCLKDGNTCNKLLQCTVSNLDEPLCYQGS